MDVREWSQSEVEYGRKVLDSGLEGARSAREAFLDGRPLTPFLSESFRKALKPAALGALLGVVSSCPGSRRRSAGSVLALGLLGGTIGFGAGMIWHLRHLTGSIASGALKNIDKVRDEHWLERHPIDYA